MTPIHILTPDAQYLDDGVVERRTSGPDVVWWIHREKDHRPIPQDEFARCDGLVIWHEAPVDEAFLARLDRCRIIVRAGVGFDHVDLAAAERAGIPVCNTPDYGTSEVADHAIAMMLALRRGIVSYQSELEKDPQAGFDYLRAPLVRRLRGRTFGVVGLGRIGTAASLRARAFGMRVLVYDPYLPRGAEIALDVSRAESLTTLLEESDVVSLHCPLTEETRGMIDSTALASMRSDAILVNTARGAIVDVPALLDALRSGAVAGAALDVLPIEPPRRDEPVSVALRDLAACGLAGRLIVTPHAAWSSPESVEDARRLSVETALTYLRGGGLRNLVNRPAQLRSRRPLD
jgi:phosphoglycerate dehydrogenase-like enzyme